jgi:hypothetical protein
LSINGLRAKDSHQGLLEKTLGKKAYENEVQHSASSVGRAKPAQAVNDIALLEREPEALGSDSHQAAAPVPHRVGMTFA